MSTRKTSRAATLVESGLRKFQEGQVEQARLFCEQALELAPRHPDALHLLGVIALQRTDHATAVELLQRAVATRPDDPVYHCNLAYGYIGLKRLPEALAAFERAARLGPGDAEFQLGVGNCLAMQGKAAEAEAVFRRLIERHPQHALAWFNLANAVKDQERYQEARDLYVRVTQLAPQFAEAYCNLGAALHKLGQFEEAEQAFRVCLARKPDFVPADVSLAITLNSLRRHGEAEALCRKTLERDPGQKAAWPILAKALAAQGRWNEALQCYERAVEAYPDSSEALAGLANMLANTGRSREALEALDRAYDLGNISIFVRFFKAAMLFSIGRVADGAAEYLARHERATFATRHPDCPLATQLPSDLQDRTVCLIGEQGIGDEIFFLRYAAPLKKRGCRIQYFSNPKITSILSRSTILDGVTANTGALVGADYNVLVGDLPHLLNRTMASPYQAGALSRDGIASAATVFPTHHRLYWPELPPPLPLTPRADRVTAAVEQLRRLGPPPYVGLTWRAGTSPQEQRGRVWLLFKEIAFDSLAVVLRGVSGTLVSLQRRPQPGETERLAALVGRPVHDLSATNEDLEEMLAFLAVLDDYIGVSSTNMHLRAGVGKTARVLVPWPPEWRWMATGDESPWFPGFRIYRQSLDGDWTGALARLAEHLAVNPTRELP